MKLNKEHTKIKETKIKEAKPKKPQQITASTKQIKAKVKKVSVRKTRGANSSATPPKQLFTRQNKELYNAFLKAKYGQPNAKTSLTIAGVKVSRTARGKLDNQTSQYFFKKLANKQWNFDKKTNTFKAVGRSPFNKKTLEKYQRHIDLATRKFTKMLKDKLAGAVGLQDPTEKQIDVISCVYNAGWNLEEFKSEYPDDYARIFEDSDEL